MDLSQITEKKGSIDKSHLEILFHKIPRVTGSKQFYFKSLLRDKQRIVRFDKTGMPMNTTNTNTKVEEIPSESLFEMSYISS